MHNSKQRKLLTEIRKSFGTQQFVADKLKISRQLLGAYETGCRNPKMKMMIRIEKYFGIPSQKLFPDLFFDQECHEMKQKDKTA